jgi:molecular chaperone DnaK
VQNAVINLPYLTVHKGNFFHAELKLSRETLDKLFAELIERTLEPCRLVLRDAGLKTEELDALILAGGMSRMPGLRNKVTQFFGLTPERRLDPTRIVVLGAAIQAGVMSGIVKGTLLLDVIPMSLGFAGHDGTFIRVVDRNTTIPTKKSLSIPEERGGESYQNADTLIKLNKLQILQGEAKLAKDNLLLDEFPIEFTAAPPGGSASIEITFDIGPSRRRSDTALRVIIKNKRTGEERDRYIVAVDPFARDVSENQTRLVQFTEEDIAAARAQADELLNIIDAAVKAHGEHVEREILQRISEGREGLQRAMQSRDAAELVGALAALSAAANIKPPSRIVTPMPAPVAVSATTPGRSVFVSYARPDRLWLDRLRVHLAPLERDGKVEIWHDGKIESGIPWEAEIERALERASAAVLLITANFMACGGTCRTAPPRPGTRADC